jgi:hypothetical protein
LLDEMTEIGNALHAGGPTSWLLDSGGRYEGALGNYKTDAERLDYVRKRVDSSVWGYLMNESGMLTFMDAKQRKEWQELVQKRECPPLTKAAISGTFAGLHENRGEIFERGIIEVFKSLSYDWKTNSPMKFGKKIIMNYVCSWNEWGWSYSYSDRMNMLDDLERIFFMLADRPPPDHRSSIQCKVREAFSDKANTELTADYFHCRWYKKGTMHVTFRRLDLVRKLNDVLAKHFPDAIGERL